MPAAIVIGGDPIQYLVAPARYGADELAVAGGIRGEAIEMVKCKTVDLEVPAHAEIIIEGEVLMDHTEPEGPLENSPATWLAGAKDQCSGLTASLIVRTPS